MNYILLDCPRCNQELLIPVRHEDTETYLDLDACRHSCRPKRPPDNRAPTKPQR